MRLPVPGPVNDFTVTYNETLLILVITWGPPKTPNGFIESYDLIIGFGEKTEDFSLEPNSTLWTFKVKEFCLTHSTIIAARTKTKPGIQTRQYASPSYPSMSKPHMN